MLQLLFVYGTLLDPGIQRAVIGRSDAGQTDDLIGFERTEIDLDGETFPTIVRSTNGSVPGSVIRVSEEDLAKIDDYEGDAYTRIPVRLASGEEAWDYARRN